MDLRIIAPVSGMLCLAAVVYWKSTEPDPGKAVTRSFEAGRSESFSSEETVAGPASTDQSTSSAPNPQSSDLDQPYGTAAVPGSSTRQGGFGPIHLGVPSEPDAEYSASADPISTITLGVPVDPDGVDSTLVADATAETVLGTPIDPDGEMLNSAADARESLAIGFPRDPLTPSAWSGQAPLEPIQIGRPQDPDGSPP